tara:strand:- start:123 stop:344 length:222 start_codon:yes stop_codon:yes gene_type:complete
MKVELLRSTMIAGTPTSAGSTIDVDDNVGRLLIFSGKAKEASETTVEVVEEVVEEKPKAKQKTKKKPTTTEET